MNVLPQFFYGMVVIGSLSMEGDGGGCGGVGRVLEGRWEGVGRALASGEGWARPWSPIFEMPRVRGRPRGRGRRTEAERREAHRLVMAQRQWKGRSWRGKI